VVSFSYWSIKPWFHTEGKLTVVLIIPSSWGSPTGPVRHHITVDGRQTVGRGKLNCIQHSALCYFGAFLTRGTLARDNASRCIVPIVYLLKCTADGTLPRYNVGALVARSIALACHHNTATTLYCGGSLVL
jgi:hypothetical protein